MAVIAKKRLESRIARHARVRKTVNNTPERPRLAVRRTLSNMIAQIIDDVSHKSLVQLATSSKDFQAKFGELTKTEQSKKLGNLIADEAKAKGISAVVFDRGGYIYHGRVQALAEELVKADSNSKRYTLERETQVSEFEDRVVHINRCAKTVKGGRRMSFSALVVVGNKKGKIGVGLGKAKEVSEAIRKGTEAAQRNLIEVNVQEGTIPHDVEVKYGATHPLDSGCSRYRRYRWCCRACRAGTRRRPQHSYQDLWFFQSEHRGPGLHRGPHDSEEQK